MIRTATPGIFQSDILIRTAILEGLSDIRANPWKLDYVFSWLLNDDLTKTTYGDKELAEAKAWFLNADIPVVMAYHVDRPQLPCIGIELIESAESNATLGDVHYETSEDVLATEVALKPNLVVGPFTPKAYDPTTGTVTMPDDLDTSNVFTGMYIFDTVANLGYQIQEVTGDSTFTIDVNVKANFTKCYIASRDAFWIVPLSSILFRESYRLRCFVNGSPVQLSFLYSVLLFILFSRKEDLLEARGFENNTTSGSGFHGTQDPSNPEIVFIRDITVTGLVRHYWPGTPHQKIDGILIDPIKVIGGGTTPGGIADQVASQGWEMEDDQFQTLKK